MQTSKKHIVQLFTKYLEIVKFEELWNLFRDFFCK